MGQRDTNAGDAIAADYVVVGAGFGRLRAGEPAERRRRPRGADRKPARRDTNPLIRIPAGALKLNRHPVLNWNFFSEPEDITGSRPLHWPRGKVLGGSSSINGMLYVRGNARDYDRWAQMGCTGWSFDDVLPYFREIRTLRARRGQVSRRRRAYGGRTLSHRAAPDRSLRGRRGRHRLSAQSTDYNGANQEGVSYSQNSRKRRFRASTAQAFLAPAKHRANLRVVTNALAQRLTFEGRRCTGVDREPGRQGHRASRRAREVIVAAGGDRLTASFADFRRRRGGPSALTSASRWCTSLAASAPTCRTITAPWWCIASRALPR